MTSRRSFGGRFRVYAALAILLGAGLPLVLLEIGVRVVDPSPPLQMIRLHGLRELGGAVVWEEDVDLQSRACARAHPTRLRVVFLGSSITYGVAVPRDEVFTSLLEKRLNALKPEPGFCVMNFAQRAFVAQQKLAVGEAAIRAYHPDVVLWEGWNEFGNYVLIGDTAYNLPHDPGRVNRFLMQRSRLYAYLVMSWSLRSGENLGDEWPVIHEKLAAMLKLADSVGARFGIYLSPPLDRPFRETASFPMHVITKSFAEAHNVPIYNIGLELKDQDFEVLRLNPCCHFNSGGHRALVPVFERIVLDLLAAKL